MSPQYIENYQYFVLSQDYAKLGLVDSAVFYFEKAKMVSLTPYDSLMMIKALKELSIEE